MGRFAPVRRGAYAVLTATLIGVIGFVGAGPASAHNYLVSSNPQEGQTLTELPERFSITTNDALLDLGGLDQRALLEVRDSAGLYYGNGCVSVEGPSIYTAAALGPAGTYTVQWVVVSLDGHPVDGEYTFEWDPQADAVLSEGSPDEPVCATADTGTETGSAAEQLDAEDLSAERNADQGISSDAVWLLGGIGVVVLVGLGTVFILRRGNSRR